MATKVIGYLRVSTVDQDTIKNEADILRYANLHNFGKVKFVEEKVSGAKSWKNRKLAIVVESLTAGDILIVPELSRLGRSLVEVLEVLKVLSDKQVKAYSVKENFQLNGNDMQSKVMRTMLGLFAEIERDLIRMRVNEGVKAAQEKGVKFGRPKGIGKSRLDQHKKEIMHFLENGATKKFIAARYEVSAPALWAWLKKQKR